jgi:hypothetical protein
VQKRKSPGAGRNRAGTNESSCKDEVERPGKFRKGSLTPVELEEWVPKLTGHFPSFAVNCVLDR